MLEQQVFLDFGDSTAVQTDMDRALMTAFCRALDGTRLAPMDVLVAMAGALGSVYRQVAVVHESGQCPCGWQPSSVQDIEAVQSAFKEAATQLPANALSSMKVYGRA